MKTVDFVQTLIPSMERARLTSLIADTRNQIKVNLIPLYKNADEAFKGKQLQSNPGKAFVAFLSTEVSPRFASAPFASIHAVLESLPERLSMLEELVNKTFGKDVVRESITYRGANILQTINSFAFISEYAGTLLDRVVAAEVSMQQGEADKVDSHLVPAVKNYLAQKLNHFAQAIKLAQIPIDELKDELIKTPEVIVIADNHGTVEATVGKERLDPLKFGFFGLSTNPFYFLGKWWSEHQVNTYNAAKEEAKTTELRLLELRESQAGRTDPKLQQQIKYNQERLEGLLRTARKMESNWAHA
jgi:hypothetical protein